MENSEIIYLSFDGEAYVLWQREPNYNVEQLIFTGNWNNRELMDWGKIAFEKQYPSLVMAEAECRRGRLSLAFEEHKSISSVQRTADGGQ